MLLVQGLSLEPIPPANTTTCIEDASHLQPMNTPPVVLAQRLERHPIVSKKTNKVFKDGRSVDDLERPMNIHEYQGKMLLRAAGVPVLEGVHCTTVNEALSAYAKSTPRFAARRLCSSTLAPRFILVYERADHLSRTHDYSVECQHIRPPLDAPAF